jgi:hypothetical protein
MANERVRIDQLIAPEKLRELRPSELRAALPPGWVPDDDGVHARRDGRVFFRHSWVLLLGLITFGSAALFLFWSTFPRGWAGIARVAVLLAIVLVIGGLVAPLITRALNRR